MTKEFKKISDKDETRYVLESATGGSSSAGGFASATTSLGGTQKRLLTPVEGKEEKAPKPRNFVAKNAKMGGAGAHKDKKKEQKQGKTKHKKPFAEDADILKSKLDTIKEAFGRYGSSNPDLMSPNDYDRYQQDQMDYGKRAFKRAELQHELGHEDEWERQRQSKPQVVAWVFYDVKPGQEDQAAMYKIRQLKNGKWAMPEYDKSGSTYAFQRNQADKVFGPGKRWVPKNESVAEAGSPAQQAAIAIAMKKAGKKPKSENAEYDDEAGMADNNLETLKRAVDGLDNLISAGDNLPEWCQEKIAVAKSMLVAVWDYMQSEEQNVDEDAPFGSNYAEQLAQQVFDHNPTLDDEDKLLNLGYNIAKSELGSRASGIFRDEDFPSDFVSAYSYLKKQGMGESAPKGWEGTVKAMKKHDEIDNPWALAHWMKNKGYKSHKKEDADPYLESLQSKLEEKAKK